VFRIWIQSGQLIRIQEGKKEEKKKEISCFEVLDVLFEG
jgi:hypothetical protein